jgi:hypothetical protein
LKAASISKALGREEVWIYRQQMFREGPYQLWRQLGQYLLKERNATKKRYRMTFGKYQGKTMEEVFLRNPSWLYGIVKWAENKSIYPEMQSHFEKLRKRLMRARSIERCRDSGCKRRAKWLTLPYSHGLGLLPQPYYWCDEYGPDEMEGISQKLRIHFDVIREFTDKWGQKEIGKHVRHALGITKGTRITEDFAVGFFSTLRRARSSELR